MKQHNPTPPATGIKYIKAGEKVKTIDISGMGGGYENECQRMLWNGINYLEANPDIKPNLQKAYSTYQGIYGICTSETEAARRLDKAVMNGIDDATGAMHQCVVGHLLFIAKNGVNKWLDEFKDKPECYYVWDGTAKSCPSTELSRKMVKGRKIRNDR